MTKKTGSEPRLRKQELFRAIGYEPHGVQLEVHRSRERLRVLACGTRYGKSTCAAAEVVAALMQPCKQSIGWVVGPNLEVTNRILERVRLAFHEHFPRRIEKDMEREKRLIIRNLGGGVSEVKGKSADATASLLGAELDFLVIDECSSVKRSVWEEHLAARLLDRRGWALLVGTPGEQDWFFDMFERGQAGTDPEIKSWRAPTWDNPHVPAELIAAEKARLPPEIFDQQFGARFILEPPSQCACCGFPSADIPEWIFAGTDEEFVYCRVCQHVVNHRGRTQIHRDANGVNRVYALMTGVPGENSQIEDWRDSFGAGAFAVPGAA